MPLKVVSQMENEQLQEIVDSLPSRVTGVLCDGAPVVVTGCAGFIGSTITEALLELGCQVTGVDCLTDYYDVTLKHENMAGFRDNPRFNWVNDDLQTLDAVSLLRGKVACFHLAAQAGVRASWGEYFNEYLGRNVMATQRLLEACTNAEVKDTLVRFVYSSSSSVYGDQADLPVNEQALPQPRSPYGVTKMAAEHLCVLYSMNFGVPTSSLRYFTVFGPRQRPDMAFRKYIEAALDGRTFEVYGDGSQTRDFTYVGDAVRSNLLAVSCDAAWEVFNTGGGSRMVFSDTLSMLQKILKNRIPELQASVTYQETALGDVKDTFADRTHVHETIGYEPSISFADGLAREVDWAIARRQK
ncbi:MAG: nucleoside-diphosphate-sugar epimerase [Candidatus Krumholzibacteriia bacterium]|jgi:nucleoside-diphosphate-sugar epimerase